MSEEVELGRIVLRYVLIEGDVRVAIDLPSTETIPFLTQLGMVEMARDTILHPQDE